MIGTIAFATVSTACNSRGKPADGMWFTSHPKAVEIIATRLTASTDLSSRTLTTGSGNQLHEKIFVEL
jgi:hypothetical protein